MQKTDEEFIDQIGKAILDRYNSATGLPFGQGIIQGIRLTNVALTKTEAHLELAFDKKRYPSKELVIEAYRKYFCALDRKAIFIDQENRNNDHPLMRMIAKKKTFLEAIGLEEFEDVERSTFEKKKPSMPDYGNRNSFSSAKWLAASLIATDLATATFKFSSHPTDKPASKKSSQTASQAPDLLLENPVRSAMLETVVRENLEKITQENPQDWHDAVIKAMNRKDYIDACFSIKNGEEIPELQKNLYELMMREEVRKLANSPITYLEKIESAGFERERLDFTPLKKALVHQDYATAAAESQRLLETVLAMPKDLEQVPKEVFELSVKCQAIDKHATRLHDKSQRPSRQL